MTEKRTLRFDDSSPDDVTAVRDMLRHGDGGNGKTVVVPDDELAHDWRSGGYPYKNLLSRKNYESQKYTLQVELLKLQAWVKEAGQRVVILFEERDAAGKGGTDQTCHAASQPAWRPCRRTGEAQRSGARPVVLPALCAAPANGG